MIKNEFLLSEKNSEIETISPWTPSIHSPAQSKSSYRRIYGDTPSITGIQQIEKKSSDIPEFFLLNEKTYGFVHEGKIYLDPEVMDSNVAVHEYTHLWDKYIQNTNPELWEKGKSVFKNTSLWKQVVSDPAYSDISGNDDLVLSECHARICGNLAKNVLEKIAREDGEITKDRIVDWDKETWEYLAKEFSEDVSELIRVKDFINLPIKDLLASKNISHKRTKTKKINDLGVEYTLDGNIYSGDLSSHLKKTSGQIDEYISKGKLPEDSRFILPPTPDYLLQTGARNTDVTIAASVIKKALNIHGLSPMQIKNAIYKLYDPVIVFDTDRTKSENKAESRLILTDEWKDGKPVAIAVNVNSSVQFMKDGHRIFLEVQDIRSIHDRELIAKNGTDLIQKWTKDGLCRYVDDKKISDWSTVNKVYFPIEALQPDSKNIILKSNIVNTPSISSSGKNNKISLKKPDNNQEENMSSQEENITKFSRNINADDESKTGLSDDGIIRKRPEQFEDADRDEMDHTSLNYVVQKLEKAGIELIADKEEFHRILEVKNHLQKMTENITGNGEEIHKINEVTRDILIKALEENAIPLTEVIYSRDNYNRMFGEGIIQSPVEKIKMGANQFIRLCPPDRNNLIAAVYETLTAPSLVLEKETYDEKTESFKPIHVYGKSFINPTNNHKRAVESIIIFKEGENIAVSLHNKGIGDFVKQIKTADEIIYMDNNISRVATLELVKTRTGAAMW